MASTPQEARQREAACRQIRQLPVWGDLPNLGDVNKIQGRTWRGKIDVLVGGTPCQAFSIAGKRQSLQDERGNLSLKFVELAHETDVPVVVWENVPGVLSTRDNAFGCFLAALVGAKRPLVSTKRAGWPRAGLVAGPKRTCAWRVLDAQYFGVAQRRRRVFLVSFRTRDGLNPGAVLFEPESVPRDSSPRSGKEASTAKTLRARPSNSHRADSDNFVTQHGPLKKSVPGRNGDSPCPIQRPDIITHYVGNAEGGALELPSLTRCNLGKGVHNQSPLLLAFEHHMQDSRVKSIKTVFPQLNAKAGTGGGNLPLVMHTPVTFKIRCGCDGGGKGYLESRNQAMTIATGTEQHVFESSRVRRLLPLECERLQGFPDGFTDIPFGRPRAQDQRCPDGPRYKALGNSIAIPVLQWIGTRINKVLQAI
ncbi:DNA cytosine methyltransferase [Desulfobaculum sp. SPO524]|uniref:DNA cytosine methyltransferase n=1 Tax=Desulfobaculum sp. SPO524 TaxID=3378071 RepID=UPI0038542AD3